MNFIWIIIAFIAGMYLGLGIMACCKLSGEISRMEERQNVNEDNPN